MHGHRSRAIVSVCILRNEHGLGLRFCAASLKVMRPAEVCRYLLLALNPSEGRRKQHKRDTTPDAIGIGLKRELLERAVREDPAPEEFEHWLLGQCQTMGIAAGPLRAMAQEILADWRLAESSAAFSTWLRHGAPSDNSATPKRTA
jgi:hypothetical protein